MLVKRKFASKTLVEIKRTIRKIENERTTKSGFQKFEVPRKLFFKDFFYKEVNMYPLMLREEAFSYFAFHHLRRLVDDSMRFN